MVLTRSKSENMSEEELIQELTNKLKFCQQHICETI